MQFVNYFVEFVLTYYVVHITTMIVSRKQREKEQSVNKKLNKLRTIPMKTLEDQKKFVNLKYPKRPKKYKFSWKAIGNFIFQTLLYFVIFMIIDKIFTYIGLDFAIWQGVLFILIFPFFINYFLRKFNIERSDISYMLRFK